MIVNSEKPTTGETQNGKVWFESKGELIWLGLTSRGVEALGELESVDLPHEGEQVEAGEVLAAVEGDSGSLEVLAPFRLEVVEINELAENNLEQIAEDPLEEGWLVKLRSKLEKTAQA